MFKIEFYKKDNQKTSELEELLINLYSKSSKSKDARIKFKVIKAYIDLLENHGTHLSENYVKKLTKEIYELRPLRYRILFFIYNNKIIVLLHIFMKKSQKTPKREIKIAELNMKNYIQRSSKYEI